MGRHDPHMWDLIHDARQGLADDLADLDAATWRRPTLCAEWDAEHVVAHLSAVATVGRSRWIRSIAGAGLRPAVHNERRLGEHLGATPRETYERFASVVEATVAPTGDLPAYLGEVLVHAEDIRRPLGIRQPPSVEAAEEVARFYSGRDFAVPSRSTSADVHLRATDSDFAHGDGPEAAGPTYALMMVMAGRSAYLDELEGPGRDVFASRLATPGSRPRGQEKARAIWSLVHAERRALISDLATLPSDAWESPSGAVGWSIHDVAAHLVDNARTTPVRLARAMAGARLDFDRQNARGIAEEKGTYPAATLARLQEVAGRRSGPPAPLASRLVEEIAHGEDVRRPLGLVRSYPDEALRQAIRYQATTPDAVGGARSLCSRVTLVADGGALRLGSGPEVRGPLLELLMLVTGRAPSPGSLSGQGLGRAQAARTQVDKS